MKLTKKQAALLLYLETRAVDHFGRVDGKRMNKEDFDQATLWNEPPPADGSAYIGFGRIVWADCKADGNHWVYLSDEAWADAHRERRAMADRLWEKRGYRTTEEKKCTSATDES